MKKLRITVDGKAYDVAVEVLDEVSTAAPNPNSAPVRSAAAAPPVAVPTPARPPSNGANAITSPLAGKIISVDVTVGAAIKSGDQVATVEAMKMNTFIYAESDGTVSAVLVTAGDMVEEGGALLQLG